MKITIGSEIALCFVLVFARVGAVMVAMPQMLGVAIPVKLRVLLAMLLAGALMTETTVAVPAADGLLPVVILVCRELAIGVVLAFVTAVVVGAVLMVGDLFGTAMELHNGGILRGVIATPNVVADGLGTFAALVFFVGGFHRALFLGLARSLRMIPAGGRLFIIALQLALPLLAPLLILVVAQGVMARLAPQINILVAAPAAIALAGLALLGLDSLGLAWGMTRAWSSMMGEALRFLNGGA
jgi:flagellar biosynthesis protein FliR